jgi:dTDP-4-dehydrorhamnose reductase
MKWMILGSGGQLGSAFITKLSQLNFEFRSYKRSELDITNSSAVRRVVESYQPDFVINTAAWTRVDEAELYPLEVAQINKFAPEILARACESVSAKFVHFSTDYVFSGDNGSPWPELESTSPISLYGKSKADGEKLVLDSYKSGSYVIRTAWLYGSQGRNFVKTILSLALKNEDKIQVVNDQLGQPTSALHLVDQVLLMLHKDAPPGIYHGTNSGEATWYQFAEEILKLGKLDSTRLIPVKSKSRAGSANRPSYSVLSHDRWVEVGMAPMSNWKEALNECFPQIINQLRLEAQANGNPTTKH